MATIKAFIQADLNKGRDSMVPTHNAIPKFYQEKESISNHHTKVNKKKKKKKERKGKVL